MKKLTKIILYSAGALALIGGTFGVVYGTSSKVRNWIAGQKSGDTTSQTSADTKSTDSSTSADSTNKGGSSSTPGNSSSTPTSSGTTSTDYAPELTLSNTDLVVNGWATDVTPTGTLTGTVTGSGLNTTDIVWESDNNTIITVDPVVTKSGAPCTISIKSYYSGVHLITARAASNLAIVKQCNVTVDDHISWCKMKQVELKRDSGSVIHKTEQGQYSNSAVAYTYFEDKMYFQNSNLQISDYDAQAWSTPEGANSDSHALHLTISPNTHFCIGFDLTTAMKTERPRWFDRIGHLVQDSYVYPAMTTCAPVCTKITTQVNYTDAIIYFDMVIPPAFDGGVVMFHLDTKFYAVHFDRYVAPIGIGGVDPTVNVA